MDINWKFTIKQWKGQKKTVEIRFSLPRTQNTNKNNYLSHSFGKHIKVELVIYQFAFSIIYLCALQLFPDIAVFLLDII